jgi:DNA-binding winged helix-turn-helix (wHTH) protein
MATHARISHPPAPDPMTTSDQPSSSAEREYSFAPFRFIPGQQLLLHGDTPVRLGNRALDILAELVERPGELVSKRELMARAWPTSVVEESNLKVHVAALRRALCDDGREHRYVATVSGRGYRFVAPVTSQARAAAAPAEQPFAPAAGEPARRLPAQAAVLAGRGETIAALLRIMEQRRCVNIVGPGGIGKSTVALPVAQSCAAQAGLELCFADLSTIPDAQFLAGAVAAAIGITIQTGDGAQSLLAALHGRPLLLVLDSCEHLIDAAAALAEQLIQGAPELRILATSREPLRIAGEYVYRLMPLAYPAAAHLFRHPAVRAARRRLPGRLSAQRRRRAARGRNLPAPGRHSARHRAGRHAHGRPRRRRAGGPPGRPLPAAQARPPGRAGTPPHTGGGAGLEL